MVQLVNGAADGYRHVTNNHEAIDVVGEGLVNDR